MRIVCVPLVPNVSVVACDSQYALLTQPQLLLLEADQSVARFTSRALVLFIGYTLTPFADASENCTQTESLSRIRQATTARTTRTSSSWCQSVRRALRPPVTDCSADPAAAVPAIPRSDRSGRTRSRTPSARPIRG